MYSANFQQAQSQDQLRFKTREEMANEFGISTKTLRRRLDKAGITFPKGLLSLKEQNTVYELFGKSFN